jgi:tRNA A37 methylthiotransferase MiaB
MQLNCNVEEYSSAIAKGYKDMNLINTNISEYGFEADINSLRTYEAFLALGSDVEV